MVITCWSAKGGAGTSVVAAALALLLGQPGSPDLVIPASDPTPDGAGSLHGAAGTERPTDGGSAGSLLVDLCGESGAILGLPDAATPGVFDWLAASPGVPPDGLARLEVAVVPGVSMVPRGAPAPVPGARVLPRAEVLAAVLAADPRVVVVDCGCLVGPDGGADDVESVDSVESVDAAHAVATRRVLAASGGLGLLVTRPCYLALRRAASSRLRPSATVLVEEPGRCLGADDLTAILDVPVLATVPWDPAVARAVDAGLLAARIPKSLRRSLGRSLGRLAGGSPVGSPPSRGDERREVRLGVGP